MINGTDISEFQGQPSWDALQQAYSFVIMRASFGTARADNSFSYNRDQARSHNVVHGFYHYAYPQYNTGVQEAQFFASVVGQLEPTEFIALDFEENFSDPVGWSLAFLKEAERLLGPKPLIYLNQNMIDSYNWAPVVGNDNGLWAAKWSAVPPTPGAWPFVAIWQNANTAPNGGGDHDIFDGANADLDRLKAYGAKTGATPTPPAPVTPAPTPLPPPAPAHPIGTEVIVQRGDTLSSIATTHGVSVAMLEVANPQIANPNLIYPGEVVYLPGNYAGHNSVYHVAPGDTLSSIAARFNMPLGQLEKMNPQITNPNLIYPGEIVYV